MSGRGDDERSEGSEGERRDGGTGSSDGGLLGRVRHEVSPVWSVLRTAGRRGSDEQVGFLAAAIAYYAFVSLVPMLLLILAVGTFVGGEDLARTLVEQVSGFLSPSGQDLFESALTSDSGRGPAGIVGLVGVLWGTLKVFRGLDVAFSQLYGTEDSVSLADQLKNGVIVLSSVVLGLGAVTVASATIALVGDGILDTVAPLTLALTLTVVFFPLYYVFPDVPMSARGAVPGAVVAAGGWTVLATGFGVYTSLAGSFALYGLLGAVLLLVTWLYFGALVVLVGVLVNVAIDEYAPAGTGSYKSQGSDDSTE